MKKHRTSNIEHRTSTAATAPCSMFDVSDPVFQYMTPPKHLPAEGRDPGPVWNEIAEVKTFYWHFEDPAEQGAFKRFRPASLHSLALRDRRVSGVASAEPTRTKPSSPSALWPLHRCAARLQRTTNLPCAARYGNGFPMRSTSARTSFRGRRIGLIPLRSCIIYALANREKFKRIRFFWAPGRRRPDVSREPPRMGEISRRRMPSHGGSHRGRLDWQPSECRHPVQERACRFRWTTPSRLSAVRRSCSASHQGFESARFRGSEHLSTLERYMKCGVGQMRPLLHRRCHVCVTARCHVRTNQELGEDI